MMTTPRDASETNQTPSRRAPMSFTDAALSGVPVVIEREGAEVVIAPLGASLRRYVRNGVELVESYGDDVIAPGAAGVLLAPWANRVRDGRWTLRGAVQQLDITEVSRNNASHGLLRNAGYAVVARTESSVTLAAEIYPQHGFPFRMSHEVTYSLLESGDLAVEQVLTNHSVELAPAALGAHPYLRLGEADPAGLTLDLPAKTRIVTDDRLLPTGRVEVSAEWELANRKLEGFSLDTAYTDLERRPAAPGQPAVSVVSGTLRDDDGRTVTLWADAEHVNYLHVFVTDGLTGQDRSVAIEPMTAPADAFNSGDGLVWLEPEASLRMRWGISSDLHD